MNKLTVHLSRNPLFYLRFVFNIRKFTPVLNTPCFVTAVDPMDSFTLEMLHRHRHKARNLDMKNVFVRNFMETENLPPDIHKMTDEEIDSMLLHFMNKNMDKRLLQLLSECIGAQKTMSDVTLKKLFRNYSLLGKPDIIEALQNYCATVDPNLYKRNGNFQHYLAKAQCMKGNAEKGLAILLECYIQNIGLRSFYRIILRELIQDTVLNRSEASLVIFKKYMLEFSERFKDHYPLVCFWHLCWSSSWFSDQMLANELLASSSHLQNIIKDKGTAFSISILRQEYNEDAVVRLLQSLLKHQMMDEYVKVLQVLFAYKLKTRDIRGCREILRNCEALGITLPSSQQGRYIKMLIDDKSTDKETTSKTRDFKLKF